MSSLENISEQRSGHYQFISNDRLQDVPTVRAITRSIEPATTDTLCHDVLERLLHNANLYAIPVIDDAGRPQFLIDRAKFIEFFAKPYTREI